mgnify:CR=1 FL=1
MEVREYKTKYVTEEQALNMKEVALNSVHTFVFVSALLLIGMALPAILPSKSLIVKACSTLSIEAAAWISVYAVCKIIIAITHQKALGELQAMIYDDHMEFISNNIHWDKAASNIKYDNIGAVVYDSKSQLLIITNTENEEEFRVTLAGKRKETRKFVANVFSTTPISLEIE